jgi:hypothetical protein
MSRNTLSRLAERVLRPGGALGDLARQGRSTVELATELRAGLPSGLSGALRAAHLREDGTLIVTVASPAWAARLRFEGPNLLARCRERHPQVKRIKVRVNAG